MLRKAELLAAASLLAMPIEAVAQKAPERTAAETSQVQENGESAEAIVVTGSRIARSGFDTPTPVTVLSANMLAITNPTSVADGLRDLPQLSGTTGVTGGLSSGSNAQITAAATGAYVDLRRLGPARTLVMQDGKRVPPNRPDGLVDTNLIPQLLLERVEIVTGGASAVYGSDAVAGVVNFIVDNRFKGLRGLAQGGITGRGDGENFRIGAAGGFSALDDRFHLVASVERYENDGIDSLCDREFGCNMGAYGGINGATAFGTPANPLVFYTGTGRANLTFGGRVVAGPAGLAGMNFNSAGQLVPNQLGTLIGNGLCINCDGSNADPQNITLVPSLRTTQGYAHAEFDLSDAITLWGQASYGKSHTAQSATVQVNQGNVAIYNGNAFLPAAAQAALDAAGPNSSFTLGKQWLSMPHVYNAVTSENLSFSGGLRGEMGNRFKWDLTGTHGRSQSTVNGSEMNAQKTYAALDAVRATDGSIVCRVTLTNPGVMPGCVPLNPFGDYTASPQAVAWVQDSYTYRQRITQTSVAANIGGVLLKNWAGDVSLSVGGEYRRTKLDVTGNQKAIDATGVRRPSTGTLPFFFNNVFPTAGRVSVKEVYAEALVPLLRDVPHARSLDLSLAARHTDYSTSGGVQTWKIGAVWDIVEALRFRVTRSHDIRAPSLFDLYAPATIGLAGFFDRLTNTNQATTQVTSGNIDLKPEAADTLVIGAIVKPPFIRGLTLSVDWYRITVRDAIAQPFTIQEIGDRCFASGQTDPLCDRIIRPFPATNTTASNAPTRINLSVLNVAREVRKGIDLELAYRTTLGAGNISVRLNGNYQSTNTSTIAPGTAPIAYAGTDFAKLKANMLLSYDSDDWSLSLRERFVGGRRMNRRATYLEPQLSPVWYTDVNLARTFRVGGGEVTAFVNVTNLFDKLPPVSFPPDAPFLASGQRYPADLAVYDIYGRRFVAGARFEF